MLLWGGGVHLRDSKNVTSPVIDFYSIYFYAGFFPWERLEVHACHFNVPLLCENFLTISLLVYWKCSDMTTLNEIKYPIKYMKIIICTYFGHTAQFPALL